MKCSLNVDAVVYGRFFQMMKNRSVKSDVPKGATTWAIAGVTFSAVCRCLGAVSGAIL